MDLIFFVRWPATTGILLTFLAVSLAFGTPATVQPDESSSKDSFIYEFLPTTNFDGGPPFNSLLTSGKTGTGHDTRSFMQFEVTGATLGTGERATLNLFVKDTAAAGFGGSPSPSFAISAEVYSLTSSWSESTVTWASQPSMHNTLIDRQVIDGTNRWETFDVTSLVQGWLSNPSTNFGLAVIQPGVVIDGSGQKVAAVYDSASGINRPFLQIVPEPTTIGAAMVLLALLRRQRTLVEGD